MRNYTIVREGRDFGPYTIEALQDYQKKGKLSGKDRIRKEGETASTPFAQFFARVAEEAKASQAAVPAPAATSGAPTSIASTSSPRSPEISPTPASAMDEGTDIASPSQSQPTPAESATTNRTGLVLLVLAGLAAIVVLYWVFAS